MTASILAAPTLAASPLAASSRTALASAPPPRLTGLAALAAMLGEDLASTLAYAAVYGLTHDFRAALALGVAAGAGAIGWRLARRRPVDALQVASLGLTVVFGALGLRLHDPRWAMLKPTLGYLAVAAVMLRPGWMARYMPPVVRTHGADVVRGFERAWAATMAALALANLLLALGGQVAAWAAFMATAPLAAKTGLGALQYATTRRVVRRRVRAAAATPR